MIYFFYPTPFPRLFFARSALSFALQIPFSLPFEHRQAGERGRERGGERTPLWKSYSPSFFNVHSVPVFGRGKQCAQKLLSQTLAIEKKSSKSSGFHRLQGNTKTAFSKNSTLKGVFRKLRFRWSFSSDTCRRRRIRKQKKLHFQTKTDTCGRGLK